MLDQDVFKNDLAMAILEKAADDLRSIGVQCLISPMLLPQGMTVSLHVAESGYTLIAAKVASLRGGTTSICA